MKKKVFHENVDDTFAEWFLIDLADNLRMFIEMVVELEQGTLTKSGRKKSLKRLKALKAVINEEIDMLGQLQDERELTNAEIVLFMQVKEMRASRFIKSIEKHAK